MSVLLDFLIQPLVLIIDIVFVGLYDFFGSPAVAAILLSVVVNTLALPLYKQANAIQKAELQKQKSMKPWVDRIKSAFHGDERYMMLSAYYRVEQYHPASVLKESFPLLLQIPIFMAAYRYLGSASILTGAAFGPISDLGAPDRLLRIGGLTLNFLPILMTGLNLISGYIYSRGQTIRLKIQIVGTALIFLLLLYNSPSGLVLYWVTGQVFSVVKNLIMETNILRERKVLLPLSVAVVFVVLILTSLRLVSTRTGMFFTEIPLALAFLYIIHVILDLKGIKIPKPNIGIRIPKVRYPAFIGLCFCLFALMGICIPASVLAASATEFVDSTTGSFQWFLLSYPLSVYAGLFLVWFSVYYYFSNERGRKILFGLLIALLGAFLINYFAFDVKPDFYYTDLSFDGELVITQSAVVLNILFAAATVAALLILWVKKERILKNLTLIIAVSLLFLGGYHIMQIPKALAQDRTIAENSALVDSEGQELTGILSLSKTEKNVLVLMMDRAISGYLPFIFDEFPEFKEAYDGFVYYPNTLSFGTHTIIGAPPLYGGYEYAPKAIADNDEIVEPDASRKEAVKVLPVLFANNNYRTVVCDAPLVGKTGFANYPDISTYHLFGRFNKQYASLFETNIIPIQKHNFLVFSIYKTAPLYMRDYIYDDGHYIEAETAKLGYTQAFIDNYTALAEFAGLTAAVDSDQGSFLMIYNNTTHEPTVLEPPEYEITEMKEHYDIPYGDRTVEGRTMKVDDLNSWKHYCVNVITYREIAKWIKTLKDLGVYDNTRIIIVADHGMALGQFDDLLQDGFDGEVVNPLLLVKDYNAQGQIKTSMELMTNADVPSLALQELIETPVNPFTGNAITNYEKTEGPVWVEQGVKETDSLFKETKLRADEYIWWAVHDNIFDKSNWEKVE